MSDLALPLSRSPFETSGRTIILVDVQNLAGTNCPIASDVELVRQSITKVMPPCAQVVVACYRRNTAIVAFGWRNARILSGEGPPAQLLAEMVEEEALASRFSDIIVGSGDGRLAVAAAGLACGGVRVTALTGRGALSARLRLACHDVFRLIETPSASAYGLNAVASSQGVSA